MPATFRHNNEAKFYIDPLNVANGRSATGVLVFNRLQEPIFLNRSALSFLSKLNSGKPHLYRKTKPFRIPKEISDLFDKLEKKFELFLSGLLSHVAPDSTLLPRGKENYRCLGFSLEPFYIMILIEKIPDRSGST